MARKIKSFEEEYKMKKEERSRYLSEHEQNKNAVGFSTWYTTIGRRRKLQLQEYKGRLYLVGCLWGGNNYILTFETSLSSIVKKLGPLICKKPRSEVKG